MAGYRADSRAISPSAFLLVFSIFQKFIIQKNYFYQQGDTIGGIVLLSETV